MFLKQDLSLNFKETERKPQVPQSTVLAPSPCFFSFCCWCLGLLFQGWRTSQLVHKAEFWNSWK
jgi:hypothetical protein